MCGRFALALFGPEIASAMGFSEPPQTAFSAWRPRYNIAPGEVLPVVVAGSRGRAGRMLRWGLVPPWARNESRSSGSSVAGRGLINARAETIAEKPSFRAAWRSRRCLVPATAFYEWSTFGGAQGGASSRGPRQPYAIAPRDDGEPSSVRWAFGGIWQDAEGSAAAGEFAIVTVAANDLIRSIHDRMPVILERDAWSAWLGEPQPESGPDSRIRPSSEADEAVAVARRVALPLPAARMRLWPVSRAVNRAAHESPDCLLPAPEPG